ncbi:MAG: carboxylesterase/lipase family protein [Parahaliea sp.]
MQISLIHLPSLAFVSRAMACCLLLPLFSTVPVLAVAWASDDTAALLVQTDLGPVRGERLSGYAVFRGIPFAAPPTGELRWRPAQPAVPWGPEPRDARAFGAVCPQPELPGQGFARTDMAEDCLTLNVVAPLPEKGQLAGSLEGQARPVMVWVHGGAYIVGSGREALDELPSGLSRRGVVLVSFNYRLGRLGFFTHPSLEREQPDGVGGNFWLSDQIAALDWVQRNIARFGGDPGNVTIFGVSAGGSSVNSLAVSPAAQGLVHRAISQSGGGLFNAEKSPEQALARGFDYARSWGFTGDDVLAQLRTLSMADILDHEQGPPQFGAIIGNRLLPESPSVAFAAGRLNVASYMAGSTSDEASIFGLMGFSAEVLEERFGIRLDDISGAYTADGALDQAELLRQVQADFIFTSGANGLAALAAKAGRGAYAYRFAYLSTGAPADAKGVPHGGEVPYVLGGLENASSEDRRIAALMQDYWTAFAATGNPVGPGNPPWRPVTFPHPVTLVIADDIREVEDFRARQLAVWYRKWGRERGLSALAATVSDRDVAIEPRGGPTPALPGVGSRRVATSEAGTSGRIKCT